MTLFPELSSPAAPLAERMRPRSFDEFVGQAELIGPQGILRRLAGAAEITRIVEQARRLVLGTWQQIVFLDFDVLAR